MKDEKYPVWDFRLPKDGEIKYKYPDSSAGAIAACGLLLLSQYVPKFEDSLICTGWRKHIKKFIL